MTDRFELFIFIFISKKKTKMRRAGNAQLMGGRLAAAGAVRRSLHSGCVGAHAAAAMPARRPGLLSRIGTWILLVLRVLHLRLIFSHPALRDYAHKSRAQGRGAIAAELGEARGGSEAPRHH